MAEGLRASAPLASCDSLGALTRAQRRRRPGGSGSLSSRGARKRPTGSALPWGIAVPPPGCHSPPPGAQAWETPSQGKGEAAPAFGVARGSPSSRVGRGGLPFGSEGGS